MNPLDSSTILRPIFPAEIGLISAICILVVLVLFKLNRVNTWSAIYLVLTIFSTAFLTSMIDRTVFFWVNNLVGLLLISLTFWILTLFPCGLLLILGKLIKDKIFETGSLGELTSFGRFRKFAKENANRPIMVLTSTGLFLWCLLVVSGLYTVIRKVSQLHN